MTRIEAMQRLSSFTASWSDLTAKIRRWWGPVKTYLTFSLMDGILVPKKSLSVSIEKGSAWVVLGSRFLSKIRIRKQMRYNFEEGKYVSPQSLASTLSLAMREMKAVRTQVTLSVPRDWVIIRTAEFPSAVKANIADVMAYELDRLTPLSAESAYYDFKILGEKDERLNLVVAAARTDLINQYLYALRAEGVFVERVTVNLSGLGTLCSYLDPARDFICLETDSAGYEGGFVHNQGIVSVFRGTFTGDPAQRASLVAEGIGPVVELAKSLGIAPQVMVYMRDRDHLPLAGTLGLPVRVLGRTDMQRLSLDQEDVSFNAAGAVLESLWPKAEGFNVLSKGVQKGMRIPKAGTLILILLLLAAWAPYVMLPLQREEKRLQEINRQISLRREEVKKVEALKKEVAAAAAEVASIDDFKETKPMALVILKELTTSLPKSVWLTRSRITENTVEIEGYASSASEILPKLEQSKYLRKVEFASPTIRDTRQNADRFVIKMELEGFAKEAGDKAKEAKDAAAKETKEGKDAKEAKEAKETKEAKDLKEVKETKPAKEVKGGKAK